LGAAGAVEAVFTVLALQRGVLPPTINQTTPDPECDLDYIPNEARAEQVAVAVSNSFGFGGHNSCVVFRGWGAWVASRPDEHGLRARGAHRSRERRDVVGAVVAAPVDEEGRRAGDAAEVGAVDVVGDPRRADAVAQIRGEAVDVEPDLLGVVHEIAHPEGVLV